MYSHLLFIKMLPTKLQSKTFVAVFISTLFTATVTAQQQNDSTVMIGKKTITLSEVVLNNKLNIPAFIERIKNDTSFYKAFRNLHIMQFSAINDIRINNSDGEAKASLYSKTKQLRSNNCRSMQTL